MFSVYCLVNILIIVNISPKQASLLHLQDDQSSPWSIHCQQIPCCWVSLLHLLWWWCCSLSMEDWPSSFRSWIITEPPFQFCSRNVKSYKPSSQWLSGTFFFFFFFGCARSYMRHTGSVIFAACRIFSCGMQTFTCGMWDPVPQLGTKPESPALGAQNLSH